jgi:hypothetical protein
MRIEASSHGALRMLRNGADFPIGPRGASNLASVLSFKVNSIVLDQVSSCNQSFGHAPLSRINSGIGMSACASR